ncbi:MAG: hypothetical protein A3F40_01435 [Chlamydiae bacterium RIFCSPHIGHO2_12_FULL_27_8]|nr:MAG: hypothetical protein A3F40_01435 [Chlamydiae bacterium RIFCSPHIGHO2_12_FULL_27_8]OGN65577.1 MAG: hypothetical protein A2888_02165 [Chlamydiae bacterium RIFCSPLOWO2_01_FULL_28_7]
MNKIFDPVRRKFVLDKPEEVVRQKLILRMINILKYPKNLIFLEKDLFLLPHLKDQNIKNIKRRADIIVFSKNIDQSCFFYPLLMIECKAVKLTECAIDQVIGYNYFVKSYFVAVANEDEIITLYKKDDVYKRLNFLPSYRDLLNSISNG